MKTKKNNIIFVMLLLIVVMGYVKAEGLGANAHVKSLELVEYQKDKHVRLAKDAKQLEEMVLYPSTSQVSVFISINAGHFFKASEVEIYVDDKKVASHQYTERELYALSRGGKQRVYTGNYPAGIHEIKTFFSGTTNYGRTLKRGSSLAIDKGETVAYVELSVIDQENDYRPHFYLEQADTRVLYGEALYHYFLDEHFQALVQLYYAQDKKGTEGLGYEPQLLEGGLQVSLAMSQRAAQTFKQVINQAPEAGTRNKARYYLAKLYYQQDQVDKAYATIIQNDDDISSGLLDAYLELRSKLHLHHDELVKAEQYAEQIDSGSPYGVYASYNLGLAYLENGGDFEKVEEHFSAAISRSDVLGSEEAYAIADKARLKWAQAGLQYATGDARADRLEDAAKRLSKVNINGLFGQEALLTHGLLLSEQGHVAQAMGVWKYLKEQQQDNIFRLESELLSAQAFDKRGAPAQALDAFMTAEGALKQAIKSRTGIDKTLKKGKYVNNLLKKQPASAMGWMASLSGEYPDTAITPQQYRYLSSHDFQESFKGYRDLAYLYEFDTHWEDKLKVYQGKTTPNKDTITEAEAVAYQQAKQEKRDRKYKRALTQTAQKMGQAKKELKSVLTQQKSVLAEKVQGQMDEQIAQIIRNQAHSRLAIARIYDNAVQAQSAASVASKPQSPQQPGSNNP